jgi:hypothetical protein
MVISYYCDGVLERTSINHVCHTDDKSTRITLSSLYIAAEGCCCGTAKAMLDKTHPQLLQQVMISNAYIIRSERFRVIIALLAANMRTSFPSIRLMVGIAIFGWVIWM